MNTRIVKNLSLKKKSINLIGSSMVRQQNSQATMVATYKETFLVIPLIYIYIYIYLQPQLPFLEITNNADRSYLKIWCLMLNLD